MKYRGYELGMIFSVCDGPLGDEKHFPRFLEEVSRLKLPFAAYFDHCKKDTVSLFKRHPLYAGGHDDRNPGSIFDEGSLRFPMNILKDYNFKWMLKMDLDETLERDAPKKLDIVLRSDCDVAVLNVLNLWRHGGRLVERTDGHLNCCTREKIQRLRGNDIYYPSACCHAPNVVPKGKKKEDAKIERFDLKVIHWGILDLADAEFHRSRWDRVYMKAMGSNPYKGYDYFFDPNIEWLLTFNEVPKHLIPEHCLSEIQENPADVKNQPERRDPSP